MLIKRNKAVTILIVIIRGLFTIFLDNDYDQHLQFDFGYGEAFLKMPQNIYIS